MMFRATAYIIDIQTEIAAAQAAIKAEKNA